MSHEPPHVDSIDRPPGDEYPLVALPDDLTGAEELTVYPRGADADRRTTEWITVSLEAVVSLSEMR